MSLSASQLRAALVDPVHVRGRWRKVAMLVEPPAGAEFARSYDGEESPPPFSVQAPPKTVKFSWLVFGCVCNDFCKYFFSSGRCFL